MTKIIDLGLYKDGGEITTTSKWATTLNNEVNPIKSGGGVSDIRANPNGWWSEYKFRYAKETSTEAWIFYGYDTLVDYGDNNSYWSEKYSAIVVLFTLDGNRKIIDYRYSLGYGNNSSSLILSRLRRSYEESGGKIVKTVLLGSSYLRDFWYDLEYLKTKVDEYVAKHRNGLPIP